jgi:outer membrane protein TolC
MALTLDDAVQRAIAASHRLEEGRARADAASAVVEQRHAVQLPRLSGQAGYTRTNHVDPFSVPLPNSQFRIIFPDIPNNYRTRLDAQWPIYTGGRLGALERAARTDAAAATLDIEAARADLRAEVARAYWTLVSVGESLRVVERSLAQVEAHLRDARNRFEAGLVPPSDVLSVEAQQARQQMLLEQMRGNRAVAEAALARLVGLQPGASVQPTGALALPDAVSTSFDALLSDARERRSDRRALAERVSAAGVRAQAVAAGRKPTIGVGGGVDYASPNPRIFPRQSPWRTSWDASVNVDWPLFDGGRVDAEVAEATAARVTAEARLAEFDSMLGLEIRQRLTELSSGRAAVTAADAAIRAATEAHRVLRERFSAGVATSTEVLDAEYSILQAELDRAQAIAVLRMTEAGLERATGR